MDNLAYKEPPHVERIEGKTYVMSPRPRVPHNRVIFNIANIFGGYLKGKTCVPFADGTDVFLDDKNQYLIIGRNPKNLFTTSDNLFELVSEKKGEQTEFRLKRYLEVLI